jgi:hypothetical protein
MPININSVKPKFASLSIGYRQDTKNKTATHVWKIG